MSGPQWREECRSCGSTALAPVIDLGVQPLSNAFLSTLNSNGSQAFGNSYPLRVVRCLACTLVQLAYDVPREAHFNDHYAYHSSANNSDHWARLAKEILLYKPRNVLEIASNDGYLLRHLKDHCNVLGVEPSDNVAQIARDRGIPTLTQFFGPEWTMRGMKWDVIIANNVFAHVPEPNALVAGIKANLAPDGYAVLEFPRLTDMLRLCAFDTIYHEHYSYWSLQAAEHLFFRWGLKITKAYCVDIHGGSYRIFVKHGQHESPQYGGMEQPSLYADFAARALEIRRELQKLIARAALDSKYVAAYGAAAKGNTLLNYCQLSRLDITCIADTTPWKQGKWAPGSHIPIVSPEEMLATKPDLILLLAWNWKREIMPKLKGYEVIVPIPEVSCVKVS